MSLSDLEFRFIMKYIKENQEDQEEMSITSKNKQNQTSMLGLCGTK